MLTVTAIPSCHDQRADLGTRSYLKTGLHSRLTAEYHHLSEKRRGGNSLDLPPHEADIAEQVQHSITPEDSSSTISPLTEDTR